MHERQKLMAMLRKYDFVLYELQLYLDTHPSCPHALRKWQEVSALRPPISGSSARSNPDKPTEMLRGAGSRDRGLGKRRRTKCGLMRKKYHILIVHKKPAVQPRLSLLRRRFSIDAGISSCQIGQSVM